MQVRVSGRLVIFAGKNFEIAGPRRNAGKISRVAWRAQLFQRRDILDSIEQLQPEDFAG